MNQPSSTQPRFDPVRRTLLASVGGLAVASATAGLSSGLAGRSSHRIALAGRRADGTPQARRAGGFQPRPGRPEHEPHLPDDRPEPTRDAQHHPDGLRPRGDLLRCRRGLWPPRGRANPWRRGGAVPGQGGRRLQVRLGHRLGDRRAPSRPQQPTRTYQAGRRGDAPAPAHRPYRPSLPAPRRPAGPHRGRRGRRPGPDEGRQGPALGPVGDGACRPCAVPMRSCR